MRRREFAATILAMAAATRVHAQAQGEPFPKNPIKLVVPFPPGGNVDTVSRVISTRLGTELRVPIIIENRAGASGIIGSEYVVRGPADGYTIMMAGSNHGTNPSIYKKLPYDTVRDFAPVGLIGAVPMALVVSQELPARTYPELIKFGKENPGALKFGVTTGAANHLATALLIRQTGLDAIIVPYKGDGPTIIDLLGNQINCYIGITSLLKQYIQTKRLPVIAITSRVRVPLFPDVPTLVELGLQDYDIGSWNGVVAPSRTPAASLSILRNALHRTLLDPQVHAALTGLGMQVINGDGPRLAQFVQSEITRWTAVVTDAQIERQ